MARILVVEDDASTRKLMRAVLTRAGFDCIEARNGNEALEAFDNSHIDLMVTDVMMPGMDGMQLVETLRNARYDLPILMVTAKGEPVSRREGFIVGTDDYLVKPVDAQEMVLRIKALLRRANIATDRRIVIGEVVVDPDNLTVSRVRSAALNHPNANKAPNNELRTESIRTSGRLDASSTTAYAAHATGEVRHAVTITLAPKEFALLHKLVSYPEHIFTRMQLLEEVWGEETESDPATVSVHLGRLRKRLEPFPEIEIETVRGVGYKATCHAE